jgi:hypothetical protein
MNSTLGVMAVLLLAGAVAHAQVAPAATRPALPVNGNLHYDLRYSETAQFGGSQGDQQWSMISGDASYGNTGKRYPFTLQYGGGYGLPWAGQSSTGNIFQHLSVSQGFVGRAWNLSAGDNIGYSFETPTVGFSGVPGSGGAIGGLGSTSSSDQSILALNTRTLDNTATFSAGRRLDHATSLNLGGTLGELLYIDNNGQNTDTLTANAGVSRRLDVRSSIAGQYVFSRYSYSGFSPANGTSTPPLSYSQANTMQFSFSRQWNRQIATSASVGPQWISSSDSALLPSSTRISASASVSDTFRLAAANSGTASLGYSHGSSGGSGYTLGAESDIANAGFSRGIGRNLTVGVTASYMRTSGLFIDQSQVTNQYQSQLTNAKFAGAQATRQLGRYFNLFANYTAIDQSSSIQNSANILSGLYQVVGFGIGYSPREIHLRR